MAVKPLEVAFAPRWINSIQPCHCWLTEGSGRSLAIRSAVKNALCRLESQEDGRTARGCTLYVYVRIASSRVLALLRVATHQRNQ